MLSVTRSLVSYENPVPAGRKIEVSGRDSGCCSKTLKHNQKCRFLGNHGLPAFRKSIHLQQVSSTKRNEAIYNDDGGERRPFIINLSPGSWKSWVMGFVISLALPSGASRLYWLSIKARVDAIEETVESVVETVEEVAEEVDKVAEEIDKLLPDGGELDKAVKLVENIAEEIHKEAELAEEALEKVKELETEVDTLINRANRSAIDAKKINN